jgi:hypothetical protein
MFSEAPFGRSRHPSLCTALLGSLFVFVACGNDTKPAAPASLPLDEALCSDGIDNDKDGKADGYI